MTKDYRTDPPPPADDPSKRPPPQTTIARVGDRYRLTYGFVERWLKRYGWHVRRKAMPTEIRNKLHGQGYGKAVNAKSDYLLEQVAGIDSTTADERAIHGAFCSVAGTYGFPTPPRPVFPDDPPPPPGKGKGKGGGQKPDPNQKPDGGEGGNDGEGEGESQPDGQPGEGEGDGQGEGEGDGQGEGQDGEGNPDESPDQPPPEANDKDGGEGGNDGESSPPPSDKTGGGFSHGKPKNDGLDYRPDYGDAEDEIVGDGQEVSEPTVQPDLGDLRTITAPPKPQAKPHPIGRIPSDCLIPKRHIVQGGGFNALLAKLREELMSVARHKRSYDRDAGDLDFRKIVDLATGQGLDRIYYKTTHAQRLNTAVQLFVDFSGSMEGGRLRSANSLAVLLSELFEKLRIPCEVIGFQSDAYVLKTWDERVADSPVGRLGPAGGTRLFNSMQHGLESLLPRRETRLIQAIITDGEIDGNEAVRCRGLLATDRRLETYGFFVELEDGHQPFLRSVDQLTPANMVEKILTTLGHVVAGGPRQARAA